MEHTINKLAKLAGISTRTLRYYDSRGLLAPKRVNGNGYRIYGQEEIDRLQQILFYRELGVELEEIGRILSDKGFDGQAALESHMAALRSKRDQLDALIENVEKSILAMKGETAMTDAEKFEGFKQKLIDGNERKYGAEIRAKYGDKAVDESNAHLKGVSKEQHERGERLLLEFEQTLKAAFDNGDPAGELAQKACGLHREWLMVFCPKYSKEYHKGLGEMYVGDDRFRANYDKLAPGCAEFLRDAINVYCS
jgi:DNA-binding transcriptional MerR regulator